MSEKLTKVIGEINFPQGGGWGRGRVGTWTITSRGSLAMKSIIDIIIIQNIPLFLIG